jgi:hypothetical protein
VGAVAHDTLTQLGYAVFLDQFVLDTSSRSRDPSRKTWRKPDGIFIWSPRNEDSEWCKQEYDAFVTKEKESGFRFVIARLTTPSFLVRAHQDLGRLHGVARGAARTGLLRLLYGLQGKALPDGAVRLAVAIDEKQGSRSHDPVGARGSGQGPSVELGKSQQLAWRASRCCVARVPRPWCR